MAQYIVIQDIEAEDKLLGPLTLRQFIYAAVVVLIGFIGFQLAKTAWYLALPLVPPLVFFGLLAAPFGQTQSSEVWLLAKIRFFLFPKKRIWDQDGIQELVHVTAPKKVEEPRTKGFSQEEVSSRLQALANTLDTRGWVIKNVTPDVFQRTAAMTPATTERLIDIEMMTQPIDQGKGEDILDEAMNPVAAHMNTMLQESEQQHRQKLFQRMQMAAKQAAQPKPTPQPQTPVPVLSQPVPAPALLAPSQLQPILNNSGAPLTAASATAKSEPTMPTPKMPAPAPQPAMTNPANTDKIQPVEPSNRDSIAIRHGETAATDDDHEVVISLH